MNVIALILTIINLVFLFIGASQHGNLYIANGFIAVLLAQLILSDN